MKHHFNFLFIALCFTSVFYNTNVYGDSGSELTIITSSSGKTIYINPNTPITENEPLTYVKTLCPAGQYVYKCGNYRVGFNWLRGIHNDKISTENYYISDDPSELLQQMRDFFAAKDNSSIRYCDDGQDSCNEIKSVSEYKNDRNTILINVCDPFSSDTAVTCAYCPDSAKIDASTVTVITNTDDTPERKMTQTTSDWKFYTIADCYTDTFTDSTGTYKYTYNSPTAEKCFYNNTNINAFNTLQGDSISGFAPGTNNTTFNVFSAN